MVRLWFVCLMFGVALTVVVAEAMSRRIEGDRMRSHDEMSRAEYEAEDAAATAWDQS